MVSQPGVGINASRILKQLSGTVFDEKNNPKLEKSIFVPFKTEIQAYRFCAMVGLAFGKRSEGLMQTKWSAESRDLAEPDFKQLFSIVGNELDSADWVEAMNLCADWGAIYVSNYYFSAGIFSLSHLLNLMHSDPNISECHRCGAYGDETDNQCWKCGENI